MQTERTFSEDLKYQFRHGGMTVRLIFYNVAAFLFINIFLVLGRLIGGDIHVYSTNILEAIFTLKTNLGDFITHPWGLFTSIFSHFGILHFLLNMIFLYFSGKMFEPLFDQRRLLYTYVLGGLMGGIFELLAHLIFPALQNETHVIVGASGSIMAIFSALAFHRPNLQIRFFGFPVRLIFLAGIFILTDLVSLGLDDGTAHFAHLGGVLIGLLSVQSLYSSSNIINRSQMIVDSIIRFFKRLFGGGTKMKVKKGGNTRSTQFKTDEQYNMDIKDRQAKTDAILDKISKSGYDSLTKAEKEFLFNQSKNG